MHTISKMGKSLNEILICSVLISSFMLSSAQSSQCQKYKFDDGKNFTNCNDLPFLNAYLYYTYNAEDSSLDFAYRQTEVTKPGTWASWGIHTFPGHSGMVCSQVFVGFLNEDGSITSYPSFISNYNTGLRPFDHSFVHWNLSATYANNEIVLSAKMQLVNNMTLIKHVWQYGPVKNGAARMHAAEAPNLLSTGTLDVLTGILTTNKTLPDLTEQRKRNLHGTLNVVGWGLMMPIGIMLGRYVQVIESAEKIAFYIHSAWQTTAYIIGVVGWAMGLQIGSNTRRLRDQTHRNLGMALFCFATFQVFSIFLRPKKDHEYRNYWNISHKLVGYGIVILAIAQIYKGFYLLDPQVQWMPSYFGTLFVLFLIAIVLEIYTRKILENRKQMIGIGNLQHAQFGTAVMEGYEGRDRYGI